jgi:hypothetical protein
MDDEGEKYQSITNPRPAGKDGGEKKIRKVQVSVRAGTKKKPRDIFLYLRGEGGKNGKVGRQGPRGGKGNYDRRITTGGIR